MNTIDTEYWASRSDFIDEAAALGVVKILRMTRSFPASETVYEYDAMNRIQRISISGQLYSTYDSWDGLGRPLHAVMAGACSGSDSTWTYPDAQTIVQDTPSGPCQQHLTTTYDADLIRTNVDYGEGTTATYTTASRATVCR